MTVDPSMLPIVLAAVAFMGIAAIAMAVRWEHQGRPEIMVGIFVGALFAQLVFYGVDSSIPVGPFRPGPLRLPELIILVAVAARLWTREQAPHVTATGMAWLAFCIWYFTTALVGIYHGHETSSVLFHGKYIVYAGGGYLLTSGVPIGRLLSRRLFGGGLGGLGAVVLIQVGYRIGGEIAPIPDRVGADAGSFYFGFGLLVLLLECTRRPVRAWVFAAMVPLLTTPFVISQRASIVHVAASGALLAMVVGGNAWRERMTIRPTQVMLGAMALLALGAIVSLPGLTQGETLSAPLTETVSETFGGVGNEQSTDARVYKWEQAGKQFRAEPLLGNGLGIKHEYFQPGVWATGEFHEGNTFDNIVLDLLVRSGVIGLVLFVATIVLSVRDAWRVWMTHPDPRVAAFGLAAAAFLLGVTAKGLVESVLEKVVLACAIGIVTGAVASAVGDTADPRWDPHAVSVSGRSGRIWS